MVSKETVRANKHVARTCVLVATLTDHPSDMHDYREMASPPGGPAPPAGGRDRECEGARASDF